MITWSEPNEYGEIVGGGYMLSEGWKLPNVRHWQVFVTSPELNESDGTEVLKYRGSRASLDEAKALAQDDYDSRYTL